METLNDCFAHQIAFSREVLERKGIDLDDMSREQVVDWSEYTLFSVVKEACEATGNYDWKRHREPKDVHDVAMTVDELVDIQKYLWNAFGFWGIRTPEQLVEVFENKSNVVLNRWETDKHAINTHTSSPR